MMSAMRAPDQAPFPFIPIFQNGPRRQGFAPPRKNSAPLTAPGRSENSSQRRERGQLQSHYPRRPDSEIRSTESQPLDDVNNLQA